MSGPDVESPIEFTATSSLADSLAANAAPSASGGKRKSVARRTVVFALLFFGTAFIAGSYGSSNDPIAFLKMMLSVDVALSIVANIVVIIVIVAGMMLGVRTLNKAFVRKLQADQRRDHPAVDGADPALRVTRAFRFDETGMTTTTAYDEIWESWARITGLDETPDLLVLRVGGILSIPLPKRQLSAELRARLQHYVDSRSNSKWPF